MTQHTLTILLPDGPTPLHRVVSLLRRHAVHFTSLTATRSEAPGVSRVTLVVDRSDATRVTRHVGALVDVYAVHDVTLDLCAPQGTSDLAVGSWSLAQADGAPGGREP